MSNPFLAEIRAVGFNFAPSGWALCDGQLLPISQNTALFSLLGTQYGGDGVSNFALPNLQSMVAIGQGQGPGLSDYVIGQTGGEEGVTLSVDEMPAHTHPVYATNVAAVSTDPTQGLYGIASINGIPQGLYGQQTTVALEGDTIANQGSGWAHENRQPFLVLNYIVALQGVFPTRA